MSSAKNLFKGTPKQQSCPICFMDFTVLKQLSCSHFICEACLDKIRSKARSEKKTPKCPFCSATIGRNATNSFAGDLSCHECLESKDCRDIWWCQTCVRLICSFCQIKVHLKTGHETKEFQDSGQLKSNVSRFAINSLSNRATTLKREISDKFLSIYEPLIDEMAVQLMNELQIDPEKEKKNIENKLGAPGSAGLKFVSDKWNSVTDQLLSFFGVPSIQTENEFIKASMKKITEENIRSKLQVVVPKSEEGKPSTSPDGFHVVDLRSLKNSVIPSHSGVATKRKTNPNIGVKRPKSVKRPTRSSYSSSSSDGGLCTDSSEEEASSISRAVQSPRSCSMTSTSRFLPSRLQLDAFQPLPENHPWRIV